MKKNALFSIIILLFSFALAGIAEAQIREAGQIQGYVKDDQNEPLPGARLL